MNWARLLSITIITLQAFAGIAYLWQGNYKLAVYWLAAALVNGAAVW